MLRLRPSARLFPPLASHLGKTLLCSLLKRAGEGEWPKKYPALLEGCEGPSDSVAYLRHCVSVSLCPRAVFPMSQELLWAR